jgi:hypothetical protein
MYCVKCGVELADSEKRCPLCQTEVVCPDGVERKLEPSPYPPYKGKVTEGISRTGLMFVVTFFFIIPILICLICDISLNGGMTWSGYAVGGMLVLYLCAGLPLWFAKPNPVIFTPVGFLTVGLYLLYINIATGGDWFLSFAFPITGVTAVIITTVVTLTRYVRGGRLYIFGGATIALGFLSVLIELMLAVTFGTTYFRWSIYPFIGLFLIGIMLIIIAICRPLRESLKRRLFF